MSLKESAKNLDLLGLFHIIYGALVSFGVLVGTGYFLFLAFLLESSPGGGDIFPLFLLLAVGVFVVGIAFALLNIFSGISIRKRKRKTLSMVAGGLDLINFPLGTALGIFTFILLTREEADKIYSGISAEEENKEFVLSTEEEFVQA